MDLLDTQKVFKIKDDVYVLNIYDDYIMLSKNASRLTFSKQLQAVVTYFKLENNYAVMTTADDNIMTMTMTIVDDFKALLFLDKHFSNKVIKAFLKEVNKIKSK